MIIESLLTSMDGDGRVNLAPMGVVWGEDEIVVKPYRETTTYRNLLATGEAVVNLLQEPSFFLGRAGDESTMPK